METDTKRAWDGDRLRAAMKVAGLSRMQVGAELGVTEQTVRNWLAGMQPRGQHLLALADLLERRVEDFYSDI